MKFDRSRHKLYFRTAEGIEPMLGIKAITTSPYHPQTDGLVERLNQTLKLMLKKTSRPTR